jgi:hypothetical protein
VLRSLKTSENSGVVFEVALFGISGTLWHGEICSFDKLRAIDTVLTDMEAAPPRER